MKISCSVLSLILVLVGLALPVRAALDDVEVSGLFKEGSDLFKEANEGLCCGCGPGRGPL